MAGRDGGHWGVALRDGPWVALMRRNKTVAIGPTADIGRRGRWKSWQRLTRSGLHRLKIMSLIIALFRER
jgi:hypothetical protein